MADAKEREDLEHEIRRLAEAGDVSAATTAAIAGYGPEVMRFLLAVHAREDAASDVFSAFAEGVWRGLPGFGWECTFRTWAYAVARRSSLRHRRDEGRRARRHVPFEDSSEFAAIEQRVRTATLSYLKTERRNRFAELRDALSPDDRTLLVLRVDRRLAWNDLARAMREEEGPIPQDELLREAARLRKRFQAIKDRLVAVGEREGIVHARKRGG